MNAIAAALLLPLPIVSNTTSFFVHSSFIKQAWCGVVTGWSVLSLVVGREPIMATPPLVNVSSAPLTSRLV